LSLLRPHEREREREREREKERKEEKILFYKICETWEKKQGVVAAAFLPPLERDRLRHTYNHAVLS
jgi:hypothetical protein